MGSTRQDTCSDEEHIHRILGEETEDMDERVNLLGGESSPRRKQQPHSPTQRGVQSADCTPSKRSMAREFATVMATGQVQCEAPPLDVEAGGGTLRAEKQRSSSVLVINKGTNINLLRVFKQKSCKKQQIYSKL